MEIPQGLSEEQFKLLSEKVRLKAGHLGSDIRVHGSRAAGTAHPDSDIDIAIRVSPEAFDQLIIEKFKTPNPGSSRQRTMLNAIKSGKIQAGELGFSKFRAALIVELGIKVDLSIIRIGGPFDTGPWIVLFE